MNKYGLIGRNIEYSFSRNYFGTKFQEEGLNCLYENFDIQSIEQFPLILERHRDLRGLNVTIPYKEAVIPYLDKLDEKAEKIGAVNTIKISKKGKLTGFNTDYFGFKKSIEPLLKSQHQKALILGTGGASKAIEHALNKFKIPFTFVSRESKEGVFTYDQLNEAVMLSHQIIINCTPLGTHPNIDQFPKIPYHFLSSNHLLYDLVYNPPLTTFLKKGMDQDAKIMNGLTMLELQAEKAWRIWNQ